MPQFDATSFLQFFNSPIVCLIVGLVLIFVAFAARAAAGYRAVGWLIGAAFVGASDSLLFDRYGLGLPALLRGSRPWEEAAFLPTLYVLVATILAWTALLLVVTTPLRRKSASGL